MQNLIRLCELKLGFGFGGQILKLKIPGNLCTVVMVYRMKLESD